MAWGRKEAELPESLRGKTPEQIAEALQVSETEKTRFEGELTSTKTLLQQQTTELNNVKNALTALQTKPTATPVNNEPPKGPASIFDNEDQAFADRMGPLALTTLQNAARLARMTAESNITAKPVDRYILGKYKAEYDALVATLGLQAQTNEVAYYNCFKIVKADHVDELTDAAKKGTDLFSEAPANGAPPVVTSNGELTDEQKRMAKKFGISDADYKKSLSAIQFVG